MTVSYERQARYVLFVSSILSKAFRVRLLAANSPDASASFSLVEELEVMEAMIDRSKAAGEKARVQKR